jgi:hypothetical protein
MDRLKDRKLDFEQLLDREGSFVVPVEKIVSCEKYGNRWLQGLAGIAYYKRRYMRIGIMHDVGVITTYCIYCVNPKDPFNAQGTVNIDKWFKKINKAKDLSHYL